MSDSALKRNESCKTEKNKYQDMKHSSKRRRKMQFVSFQRHRQVDISSAIVILACCLISGLLSGTNEGYMCELLGNFCHNPEDIHFVFIQELGIYCDVLHLPTLWSYSFGRQLTMSEAISGESNHETGIASCQEKCQSTRVKIGVENTKHEHSRR